MTSLKYKHPRLTHLRAKLDKAADRPQQGPPEHHKEQGQAPTLSHS